MKLSAPNAILWFVTASRELMSMRPMTRPITWLMAAGVVAGVAGGAVAQTHVHGHTGHAAHSRAGSDTPATRESKAAHALMMRNMAVPFTGDADVDFRMH